DLRGSASWVAQGFPTITVPPALFLVWLAIGVFLLVSTGDSLGMGLPRRKMGSSRSGCARSVVTQVRRCWRSRTPHHEANLSPRVHPRSSGVRRPALPPTHRVP